LLGVREQNEKDAGIRMPIHFDRLVCSSVQLSEVSPSKRLGNPAGGLGNREVSPYVRFRARTGYDQQGLRESLCDKKHLFFQWV